MPPALAHMIRTAALVLALLFTAAPSMAADPVFPDLAGRRVVDEAHILPADVQQSLTAKLEALETKTGDQLEVVTVKSLNGDDIASYGYQLGRHWGIGQKEKNNGVLLIVAPNERKVRIEVGYGLEGVLTDALSSVIIPTRILPKFTAGDLPGGVTDGVDAISDQLSLPSDQATAKVQEAQQAVAHPHRSRGLPIPAIIVMIIIFVLLSRVTRGGIWPWLFLASMSGRGGGGGWSGGGGGGGFSGGGGSFGGGGSSGSW